MENKYISLSILDTLDKELLERILDEPYKIICKNFNTESQEIKKLNELSKVNRFFWKQKESTWNYYILENDVLSFSNEKSLEPSIAYSDVYDNYTKMDNNRRLSLLNSNKQKLKSLEFKKDKNTEELTEGIVSSTNETLLVNKVIFDDLKTLSPEDAKIKSKQAVDETSEIVKIAGNLLSEFSGDLSIFSGIIEKSNGSTLKHMTRTFVLSLAYFQFYNKLLENTGYISKLRTIFDDKYRSKYEKLFPEINYTEIKLERVFKGGMRQIPEMEKNAIGVGFLLHDLGKQVDIEYFEGSEGYQRERIEAHAVNGFNDILKRTVYPPVVSAIAGFHHEYYGHKSGYGAFRELIKNRFPSKTTFDYCIAFSLHEVYNGTAYSFFPAKMLEIVDVFDALTDPGRKYRDPMSSYEALEFMDDHFLKDEIKIDPILFDIFKLFMKEREVLS